MNITQFVPVEWLEFGVTCVYGHINSVAQLMLSLLAQFVQEGALHSRNTLAVPDYIDMDEEELALQQVKQACIFQFVLGISTT